MPRCAPHLTIASRTSQLARVRKRVACWAKEAGLSAADADALVMAVDEACANAIEHGYEGRPDGRVELEATMKPKTLEVTVRHHGRPLDPEKHQRAALAAMRAERRVHGYGLHLMHLLVDDIAFRARQGASEVRLVKRRSA